MARQVLPIVGAVIGAYFNMPQLGYMIGPIVGESIEPEVISGSETDELGECLD